MVARSGVIFLVSMANILTNPVKICFGSFTATSTVPAAMSSPMTAVKIVTTSAAAPVSDLASETHLPKPYGTVQGIKCVIGMTAKTHQICERAQRSTLMASHRKTFPFGLRPPNDVYAHQTTRSPKIQSGRRQSSGDPKPELCAHRDPLDVSCTYQLPQGRTT
jgi:hypothetical protein